MSPHARETRPFAAEVKFVIPADLRQQVRSWARENLEPDPYGGGMFNDTYHTTSLYFDTAAGDVFHRRRSFGRSKYRVRRYGSANFVFLERKLRSPGFSSNGERPSRWIRSRGSRCRPPIRTGQASGFIGGCSSRKSNRCAKYRTHVGHDSPELPMDQPG